MLVCITRFDKNKSGSQYLTTKDRLVLRSLEVCAKLPLCIRTLKISLLFPNIVLVLWFLFAIVPMFRFAFSDTYKLNKKETTTICPWWLGLGSTDAGHIRPNLKPTETRIMIYPLTELLDNLWRVDTSPARYQESQEVYTTLYLTSITQFCRIATIWHRFNCF